MKTYWEEVTSPLHCCWWFWILAAPHGGIHKWSSYAHLKHGNINNWLESASKRKIKHICGEKKDWWNKKNNKGSRLLGICCILWSTTNASDSPTLTGWFTELMLLMSTGTCQREKKSALAHLPYLKSLLHFQDAFFKLRGPWPACRQTQSVHHYARWPGR